MNWELVKEQNKGRKELVDRRSWRIQWIGGLEEVKRRRGFMGESKLEIHASGLTVILGFDKMQ